MTRIFLLALAFIPACALVACAWAEVLWAENARLRDELDAPRMARLRGNDACL